jgi:hypothetical protein
MALKYSTTIIADRLTTLNTDIGTSAKLRIYSGSRPASVNTALGAQVMLAELICNASAFGSVAAGALTAGAIANATAAASGTAAFFRLFKSDGTTACVDGDVGTSGADLNLTSTSITAGQTVGVSSFVITGAPV